jgi:hypothetical protein
MTDKEAMKLALDALEESNTDNDTMEFWDRKIKAIAALKDRLAQEKALQALHNENERLGLYRDAYAEQEPVAWFTQARNFVPLSEFTKEEAKLYGWNELYLRPPQRKPLTDEEAFKLVEQDNRMEEYAEAAVRLIRRTEAAHGIKE